MSITDPGITPALQGADADNYWTRKLVQSQIMIKSTYLFFSIILVIVCLTGCQHGALLKLWNNSGADITVTVYDSKNVPETFSIASGKYHRISFFKKAEIRRGDNVWTYSGFPGMASYEHYIHHRGPLPFEFIVQLESDGRIYIVNPDAPGISSPISSQPTGFPRQPN